LSLRAPIAVPVEIRAPAGRVFRLTWNVGEDGIRLVRGVSLEPGRPVDLRFALPDGPIWELRAEIAGGDAEDDDLLFLEPPAETRALIRRYVLERLGLRA
jgi:hypothetical protein